MTSTGRSPAATRASDPDILVPRIALATCDALPDGWPDDALLANALRDQGADVRFEVWDDQDVDWTGFDLVMVRSTWDYTLRREEFVSWAGSLDGRLHNAAAIIEWNSDKRYLADLDAAGIATVPTRYVGPGDAMPELDEEVVIKPTVSAGARDTGRFGPALHGEAGELIAKIAGDGRTAMVQPYLAAVAKQGETSIVFFEGAESHVLRKSAILETDGLAPLAEGPITAAAAMFAPELVVAGQADERERELAGQVLDELQRRFGQAPLYARVDMIPGPGGAPLLLELEAVEPTLYFETRQGSEKTLATALLARAVG
jgi:hypothetical protein